MGRLCTWPGTRRRPWTCAFRAAWRRRSCGTARAPSILPIMTSVKKSMMRRPSSVFSRTMSARVGGFRSSVVSVVCVLVWDMCSIMWEDWVVVKRGMRVFRWYWILVACVGMVGGRAGFKPAPTGSHGGRRGVFRGVTMCVLQGPGSHPHPVSSTGQALNPLPSRERRGRSPIKTEQLLQNPRAFPKWHRLG